MNGVRDWLKQNPAIGWAIALVACGVAVYFAYFSGRASGRYMPEDMTAMVTIKFTDTGEEIEIPRGRLVRDLMLGGHDLDPTRGIINPKTGQATGFPFNKNEWERMLKQIQTDRAAAAARQGGKAIPPKSQPVPVVPAIPVEAETPAKGG